MTKAFKFSETGLPEIEPFEQAAEICKFWLDTHMSQFGDKGIRNFMMNQPVRAAKLLTLQKLCTPSSLIVALLGPAKFDLIANASSETLARQTFGDDAVDLIHHLNGKETDNQYTIADGKRLFLVEGMSTMNDQLIGRKRIDRHHQVRWNILNNLEKHFEVAKGQNPILDKMFAADLKKSRAALEALDKAAAQKPQKPKKGPQGPR